MSLRLCGAIDMHCHFGPDAVGGKLGLLPHSVTALDAAREARGAGHRALVLKSHSFASPALATALEQAVPGLRVFGGICTDWPTGGLNVFAVEVALSMGARIVWMPTINSQQDMAHKADAFGYTGTGLTTVDSDGRIVDEVQEIFALTKKYDAILATGHISALEHYALAREFGRRGRILVTHAGEELAGPRLTTQQCEDLADLGATIELTALSCQNIFGLVGKSPVAMGEMIRAIGPQRCTLGTDYGWTREAPHPAVGMNDFLESLWRAGISEDELTTMVCRNPARLLGLD